MAAANREDLHNILEGVLTAHRNDIHSYSSGHLNEANLYNPTKVTSKKPTWKKSTSCGPPKHQKSVLPGRQTAVTPGLEDTIMDFSFGTARAPLKVLHIPRGQPSSSASSSLDVRDLQDNEDVSMYSKMNDGVLIEEVKLSDTMLTRAENYLTKGWVKEDFRHQKKVKPMSLGMMKDENLVGMTKHHFLPNYLENVTKRDQYQKMKNFESKILRKQDATEQKVLSGLKAVQHLESKLKQDLDNLPYDGYGPNFHRLQLYSNTFDALIADSITFGYILKTIKKEYDLYVSSLLDSQRDKHRLLYNQVEELYSNGASNSEALDREIKRVNALQAEARDKLAENDRLRKALANEKYLETLPIEVPTPVRTTNYPENSELEIAEQIEQLHSQIMEKMAASKELKDRLRKDYVPSTVTQHLEQCIKETEVEIQKLTSSKDYFERSINEMQKDLHEAIEGADTTERDAKRVWKRVSAVKLLGPNLNSTDGSVNLYSLEDSDSEDDASKWSWYIS
ncbi:hypothetical protein CAPTEDRAFT_221744 [Capitella teleta]|uniref:Translin-associated factor X-interacting protein 1 N-terminal domain-containing protein n=1 Tax=Capitella teleta TaxID=283909 RepID=R7VLG1_CAPTE|nr:hypothetical protein CAPTEDRAFT_221744 [Capitella teleta]|eukprot:ELU18221.1 hypothetical protein CAPTEDRAFT_221744 [Capitella teleta]